MPASQAGRRGFESHRPLSGPAAAALLTALAAAPPAALAAQGRWTAPQLPCDVSASHFKVNGGVLYLKTAAEKPAQRDAQLAQARKVLTEAIVQDKQDKNPAAWYYLGRYYAEVGDAGGADTAFARAVTLAPQCKQDVAGYQGQLWAATLNKGVEDWRGGKEASAVALFPLAARLRPANPKAFIALAGLYAGKERDDSAVVYYRAAVQAAGTDTAFARDRRDALSNVARLALSRARGAPAVQRSQQARAGRDSLAHAIANDSTVLAKMAANSASRKRRGARLAPADQQSFARDSAVRVQSVSQGRTAREALAQRGAVDSAAVAAAYAPAIAAYRDYVAAYPDNVEAAGWLATLYGQSGRVAEAAAVFDTLLAHATTVDPEELFATGQRLISANLLRPGTRALALGLAKNPYRRDALFYLAASLYALRDSAGLLPAAQRLTALDPLNRAAARFVAAGWDLLGRRDSTVKYLRIADSVIAVDVTVSSFAPDSTGYTLTALATNQKSAPSKPFRLTFEFLDGAGRAVATLPTDVPAIAPGESHQIDLHVSGKGIAGWRYRPS